MAIGKSTPAGLLKAVLRQPICMLRMRLCKGGRHAGVGFRAFMLLGPPMLLCGTLLVAFCLSIRQLARGPRVSEKMWVGPGEVSKCSRRCTISVWRERAALSNG